VHVPLAGRDSQDPLTGFFPLRAARPFPVPHPRPWRQPATRQPASSWVRSRLALPDLRVMRPELPFLDRRREPRRIDLNNSTLPRRAGVRLPDLAACRCRVTS
jgi:hypothetical protein